MLPRDAKPEAAATPCACCGKPAEAQVWQLELCLGCVGRWHREVKLPALPPIGKAPPHTCGDFSRDGQWQHTGDESKCAGCKPYRDATAAWLAGAKARAA